MFQSEVEDSFLRSVRDGNLALVLEHLDYAGVHVATCGPVRIYVIIIIIIIIISIIIRLILYSSLYHTDNNSYQ